MPSPFFSAHEHIGARRRGESMEMWRLRGRAGEMSPPPRTALGLLPQSPAASDSAGEASPFMFKTCGRHVATAPLEGFTSRRLSAHPISIPVGDADTEPI